MREITARLGVPLVFDEIVTGLRFAYGGAQQYYGVVPDLAAFGKIVGGGFPLAAVAGRRDIMRHFSHELDGSGEFVQQAGTLSGNPIAAAAGLATLAELRKPGAYEGLFATGRRLKQGLETAARRAGLPAQVTVGAISCRLPPDRVGRGPPLMGRAPSPLPRCSGGSPSSRGAWSSGAGTASRASRCRTLMAGGG